MYGRKGCGDKPHRDIARKNPKGSHLELVSQVIHFNYLMQLVDFSWLNSWKGTDRISSSKLHGKFAERYSLE